jgi:hypothetical protein
MTAVGKILVFLNLVFSLVVGAFVIMIYLARVHWVEADKAKDNQIAVLAANAQAYQNDATTAKQEAAARVDTEKAERKKVEGDLLAEQRANGELRVQLSKLKQNNTQQTSQATASVTEVEKRQKDVEQLRETLNKEQELNNKLVKESAEFRNQATVATIERRAVQDQNNRLEGQLQQMAKDMARMRANGGSTAVARSDGKNPPAESVEGLVKTTDPGGLMTISVGSDSGLSKGHTLYLFRLNSAAPTQSKYLGTVRILEAGPKESVVQPVGRLAAPPRAGDQVASRILGG